MCIEIEIETEVRLETRWHLAIGGQKGSQPQSNWGWEESKLSTVLDPQG
jgi:hypothetical protein